MRFLLRKAVPAGLIAALVLTATPVWANSTGSVVPESARERTVKPEPLAFLEKEFTNFGRASWYGKSSHGKPTASGRIYDRETFTAAHPTLPFGTVLRVYNLTNKRQVIVTITDRGPFSRARVLDLSQRAAKNLNMTRAGVASVIMEVVAAPDGRPLNEKNGFYLRLERTQNAADAHRASAAHKARLNRDIRVLIQSGGPRKEFDVCIGPFADFASAEKTLAAIEPTVKVKDIVEGPTLGADVPLRTPPAKMAVAPDGRPRKILSEK